MTLYAAGDKLIHIPTETKFTLVKPVRQRSTGRLFLSDGENRYPADECKFDIFQPWLQAALNVVNLIVSNPEAIDDYDLFVNGLEPEHKAELAKYLTPEQKRALTALKRQAEETIAVA